MIVRRSSAVAVSRILCIICLALSFASFAGAQSQVSEIALINGRIFTAESTSSYAQALLIRNDRIIAVGSTKQILRKLGKAGTTIDLGDRLVIPGINDAHIHWGAQPSGIDLKFSGPDPDWSQVLEQLGKAVAAAPKGTWIYGTVGPNSINDPRATRDQLDDIVKQSPVLIGTPSGHGLILNSEAMHLLSLRDDEPDAQDLHFDRVTGTHRLSGRFFEYEQWILSPRLVALLSESQVVASINSMGEEAVRYGITSMQLMPVTAVNEFVSRLEQAALPIRIRVMDFTLPDRVNWAHDVPSLSNYRDSAKVRVSGLKWILDGTPLERGAALRKPYTDAPDWYGKLDLSDERLQDAVQRAWKGTDRVLFHVAGDRAADVLLREMEKIGTPQGWKQRRVRFEHGDGLLPDLRDRALRLGVIVVQNPIHFNDPDLRPLRFGSGQQYQPLRSLIAAGVPIALGSDGPMNPYLNIMFAAIHPAQPKEAISREEAVVAYTRGSAFAEFQEKDKGTLSVGKFADLAVLSDNIFTIPVNALPPVRSILTIVGGKIVYDADILKPKSP